ncbi:hypothetical protein V8E55_007203 [Tylopilus felleus]
MADPNLEAMPNYRGDEFAIIRGGLRQGYNKNDDQVVEHLIAVWEAERNTRIAAWNAQREAKARQAAEAEQERRHQQEEEERAAIEEAERVHAEAEKKKPKMNIFIPGSSISDILLLPPSQYALQKLSTFDYIELWYFSLAGRTDAAKYNNKSQADDTFVRASKNAIPEHELSISNFLQAKNCFLEHTKMADWPTNNLDALAKFFWFLETHPQLQLPLGNKIILVYASRVRQDWHRELKADRGYDISIVNGSLMRSITDEVRALDEHQIKSQTLPVSS